MLIEVAGGHLDPAVDPGGSADIDFKLVAGGGINLRVFILNKAGRILVWEEGKEKSLCRVFSLCPVLHP